MNEMIQSSKKNREQLGVVGLGADHTQYLTFMLGGEVFAIGILGIKEIIEYSSLTVVPMAPDCIRGVINLRGAVVPVIDLMVRFGKPSREVTKRTCIVIVEIDSEEGQQVVGMTIDAVNAVLDIPVSEIEPPPTFGAKINTEFMDGMGKVDGKFVILLNINHVLSVDEIGAITEIATRKTSVGAETEKSQLNTLTSLVSNVESTNTIN